MTQSSPIAADKQAMREEMIARRKLIPAEERAAVASALARCDLGFVDWPAGATVSGYAAMGDELDPQALMTRLSEEGHPLALPVTTKRGEALKFRQWTPGGPLEEAEFGLRQPPADAAEVEPDILLVPLLAFDEAGYRLGFGAGYYDRTLVRLRALNPITAIGIAFDQQKVEKVPHDSYDERLDWVLTPSGPLRIEG